MPATTYDFTVEQGTDYTDEFTILDESGSPDDLTGSTFDFEVKEYSFSKTNKLLGTISNNILSVTAPLGKVFLNLSRTDLLLLDTKYSKYVLFRLRPSGLRERVLEGTITSKLWG